MSDEVSVEPAMSSGGTHLSHRAASGAVITMGAQGVKLVIQVVAIVVMSRMLTPDDFGIFAMALPVYVFALLFQDVGFSSVIIQRAAISNGQITNLFWVNIAICVSLSLLIAACSGLVAQFYGEPRIKLLVLGFCGVVILNGLASQHLALINRDMRFSYLAILDVASYTLGFLGSFVLAVKINNYWALFAAPVITALVVLAGVWAGSRWKPSWPDFSVPTRDLIAFGGTIFAFNFSDFFTRNTDNILLGKFWGQYQLGVYDRANKLLLFPIQQVNLPLSRVLVPILSRLNDEDERYCRAYLYSLAGILLATQPGIIFMIVEAKSLIPLVLGRQWAETGSIFQWLGAAALIQPLTYTTGWLFVSQGRTSEYWRWGLVGTVITLISFAAGIPWGAQGMAIAYAIRESLIRTPMLMWVVTRSGPITGKIFLKTIVPFVMAGLVCFGVSTGLAEQLSNAGISRSFLILLECYLVFPAVVYLFPTGREAIQRLVHLAIVTYQGKHEAIA